MARLQILELPAEHHGDDTVTPWILVVDQYQPRRYISGLDQEPQQVDEFDGVAELIGARAVLAFVETVEIPANHPAPDAGLPEVGDGQFAKLRRLQEQLEEARMWARHGYEIGQEHCGWTDHGVAPDWLTEDWPHSFDSCEHLKRAAELEESEGVRKRVAKESRIALLDALGMDHTRDWDDIRNAAAGIRKQRDAQSEAVERVRNLSTKPDAMRGDQERPDVWKDGYKFGILAAQSALRPRDEPTVKP